MASRARRVAVGVIAAAAVAVGAVTTAVTDTGSGTVYYVGPHGSAITGCTKTAPCGRLANALNLVQSDQDEIELLGGTYTAADGCYDPNATECVKDAGGAVTGAFKTQQDPGCVTTCDVYVYPYEVVSPSGATQTRLSGFSGHVLIHPAPGATVTFERDLQFTAPHIQLDHVRFVGAQILIKPTSGFDSFTRLDMSGQRAGRYISGGATNVELGHSRLVGNVDGGGASFGATASTGQFTGLWVHDNVIGGNICLHCSEFHNDALHVWGYDASTIERNTLYDVSAIALYMEAIFQDTTNLMVRDNVIQSCKVEVRPDTCTSISKALQMTQNAAQGITFSNVTILNNSIDGEALFNNTGEGTSPGLDVRGNVITKMYTTTNPCASFTAGWATYNVIGTTLCSPLDASNDLATPQFVDPDTQDLRLQAGSPGVDLGVVGATATDKTGKKRDSQPDAGAFER